MINYMAIRVKMPKSPKIKQGRLRSEPPLLHIMAYCFIAC